jgi:transcription elongation factor GreB
MSKAFVREDDVIDDLAPLPLYPVVPPGAKNYLTASGAQRLREELARIQHERSTLSAEKKDAENRPRLQGIEHRIRHLQQSLRTAEVVLPVAEDLETVRFGAMVTVRDDRAVETRYRIVGVDEADLDRGEVSWLSPIARALTNRRSGETVRFKAPRGPEELRIVKVSYT